MATYYWVGGTGTWDNSSAARWSASSGGAGGAGYPVAGDTAIFNASSGGGTCTLGANVTCAILTMTGYTGTLAYGTNKISIAVTSTTTVFTGDTTYSVSGTPLIEVTNTGSFNSTIAMGATTEGNSVSLTILGPASSTSSSTISGSLKNFTLNGAASTVAATNNKTIYGNLTLIAGSVNTGALVWTFAATSGTQTITSNGITFDQAITIATGGATVILADALNMPTRATIFTSGTFDANGFNHTTATFTATGAGTRTLNMGSGTWTITTTAWNLSGTNITLNSSTSTLYFSTSTSGITFTPGNFAYYNILIQGGGNTITFAAATGSTYNNITNNAVPLTVVFTASNTYTFANWTLNGTSADDVTVTSTSTSVATISKSSGTVTSVYLAIAYITATGGATWVANTSWTGPSVTGWSVTDANTLYWTGTGTWDLSSTTNWAATSGGAGGAGCPTSSTRVVFTTGSGAGVCTLGANVECKLLMLLAPSNSTNGQWIGTLAFGTYRIDVTGQSRVVATISSVGLTITGTPIIRLTANATSGIRTVTANATTEALAFNLYITAGSDTIAGFANIRDLVLTGYTGTVGHSGARTIWGSLTNAVVTWQAGANIMTLRASSAATIYGAGSTINCPITINSTSTYTLTSALTMISTRALVINAGTFDAAGYDVTLGSVTINGAGVVVTMGSGTWTVALAWTMTLVSSLSCGTSTIKMTSASAKTFAGGGLTYYILDQGGAGALTISGNNTFNNWTATYLPSTITVTAGSTQTFTNFTLSGILNDTLTINSTAGTYTFSKASGTVAVTYIAITNCIGAGGATWTATYSTQTTCTNWTTTNLATTYYWVGGTGTWDNSSTARWSLTSGGAGGAGYPLPDDIVIFNSSSGGGTCTIGANVNCKTLTMTGYTGTLAFGTNKISIAGANATVYAGDTTYSTSGTTRIDFVYPGRTGTRTLSPGAVAEANAMSIYITAGIDIFAWTASGAFKDVDFTGFSGTWPTSTIRTIWGSFVLSPTMTVTGSTSATTFSGSGSHTINFNGVQYAFPVNISSTGGTYTLLNHMDMGLTRQFTITGGTFDAAGYNVTMGLFATSGTTTKVVNMGSGIWVISSTGTVFSTPAAGNLTWNANTSTLSINAVSSSLKIVSTATVSNLYNVSINSSGITRFNSDIAISTLSNPQANITINMLTGVVMNVYTSFAIAGNSTTQAGIACATPGSIAYVSSANGLIHNPQYLTITDVGATGGARWRTYDNVGNINGGNSPGWLWYQSNVSNTAFFEWLA